MEDGRAGRPGTAGGGQPPAAVSIADAFQAGRTDDAAALVFEYLAVRRSRAACVASYRSRPGEGPADRRDPPAGRGQSGSGAAR